MVFIFFKLPGSTDIDQGTIPLLLSTESAIALTVAPNVAEVADKGSFDNISIRTIYINSVGRQSGGNSYNVPLLQIISSILYIGEIEWVPMIS